MIIETLTKIPLIGPIIAKIGEKGLTKSQQNILKDIKETKQSILHADRVCSTSEYDIYWDIQAERLDILMINLINYIKEAIAADIPRHYLIAILTDFAKHSKIKILLS